MWTMNNNPLFPGYLLSHSSDLNLPTPAAIPGPDPFLEIRIAHAPAPQNGQLQITLIDHRDQSINILLTSETPIVRSAVNSINALGNPFSPADPRTNYTTYMQNFYARTTTTNTPPTEDQVAPDTSRSKKWVHFCNWIVVGEIENKSTVVRDVVKMFHTVSVI